MGNLRRIAEHLAQSLLSQLDFFAKRNPRKRFARLFEDVVGECPLIVPGLHMQRFAATGQIIEVAALLRLPNLLVDRRLPCSLRSRIWGLGFGIWARLRHSPDPRS